MSSRPNEIAPREADALADRFGRRKPLIGTIHVEPMPGAPTYEGKPVAQIVARAVSDAQTYAAGGIDGLIVENEGDIPFRKPDDVGPDTVAGLTAVSSAVRSAVTVPVGVNCLANAVKQSFAVAAVTGGSFVRSNQWTNAYVANEGFVEGAAAEALRYRSALRAGHVAVFADVHVKHGSHAIVADRSLEELTWDAEFFRADVLIATGTRTGDGADPDEVERIKRAASRPVLIGSGLTVDNAKDLLSVIDGAIVGSAMKQDGVWWNPVDVERVRAITNVAGELR